MRLGDTYRAAQSVPGPDQNRHLWIVLSDPEVFPDEVLTVFATEWKSGCDPTCLIEVGDHPFITKKTSIAFTLIEVRPAKQLDRAIRKGLLLPEAPMDRAIVQRIRQALPFSRAFTIHIEAAIRQGFDIPLPPVKLPD